MAKSKKSGRGADWRLPVLAPIELPPDAPADADALWRFGEAAEEAFDYELARAAYRAATRASAGGVQRERLVAYAGFLVERYGQFPEVAAWLDDDAFDPTGASDALGRRLAALVARAASESRHPRADALDEALAHSGDGAALGRVASRLSEGGRGDDALALLEAQRAHIAPLSPAARLLDSLRASREREAEQALRPVLDALERRALDVANDALADVAPPLRATAAFRAALARRDALDEALVAEGLRAAVERALDNDDLEGAVAAAERLAAHPQASEGDARTRDALARKLALRRRDAVLAEAAAASGEARLRHLLPLLADADALDVDAAVSAELRGDWQLLRLAHQAASAEALLTLLPGVVALGRLQDALAAGDEAAAVALLDAQPAAFLGLEPALAAQRLRERQQRAARHAREAAIVAEVAALLDAGALDEARAKLDDAGEFSHGDAKKLRVRLDDASLRRRQRALLIAELDRAEQDGRLFAARRALAALRALDDDAAAVAAARSDEVERRAAIELRATPRPPFGLSIGDGRVSVGYGAGRLTIVADRLWLAVNVETRGVAPFELPEAWRLDDQIRPRIGERLGRIRMLGSSAGRLVAIEAESGGRPEVVQGRPIAELTRGEERILAAGLDPDADVLALLVVPRGEQTPHIVRIDAETFEVLGVQRHKPELASLTTIANDPEGLLVATTALARQKRGFALARYGFDGAQRAAFDQQTLGEPLAKLRRAIAWPEEDRLYASYASFDLFDADRVMDTPSLLVLREDRIVFASSELRRRFAPTAPVVIDHAWALDTASGRLWFATLPREGVGHGHASLLGVDARTLRPQPAFELEGVDRVIEVVALPDGAIAFCALSGSGYATARARSEDGEIAITIDKLPI